MTPGFTYWSILQWLDKLGKIDTERNPWSKMSQFQDLPDEIILKVFFDSVGKKQKQIHLCTANFEKKTVPQK